MIECVISTLIWLLVIAIVLYLAKWVIEAIAGVAIPPKVIQLVGILVLLICILRMLECTGLLAGAAGWPRWR
jgi:hypothetical protein